MGVNAIRYAVKRPKSRRIRLAVRRKLARSGVQSMESAAYNRGFDDGFGKGQATSFGAGFDEGFNQGFNGGHGRGFGEGYSQGSGEGYHNGYMQGTYAGGDAIVDRLMPEGFLLPGLPVEAIIAAGLQHYRTSMMPIMGTTDVVARIVHALDSKQPLSLIRLGDGELLTMAQESVHDIDYVRRAGPFLPYAGVSIPDLEARDQLVQAVRSATIVGIPLVRIPNFQHLAIQLFDHFAIPYRSMALTHSTINYAMYQERALPQVLAGRRVLLVGNQAGQLAHILGARGVAVSGVVAPVNGVRDASRIVGEIAAHDFDIALVSAGIAAVMITCRIASELGKVAIDFGHLADSFVSGEAVYE